VNGQVSGTIPDFAIIGSGVSGGRMACELTGAGARCLLLEAGSWFDASSFPGNELDASARLYWGGGIEHSADGTLGFLRSKCDGPEPLDAQSYRVGVVVEDAGRPVLETTLER
jgi:choline dehydrogenase-like flavoprotein